MAQFQIEEESLEAYAPRVTSQCAVGADDAVTGNDNRQWVAMIGATHGAGDTRPSQGVGQTPVGRRFAVGHLQQRLPHGQLERGASRYQWQVKGLQRTVEVRSQLFTGVESSVPLLPPGRRRNLRLIGGDEP